MLSLVQNKGVLGSEGFSREGFFLGLSRSFVGSVRVSKSVFLGFSWSFLQGFSQGFSGFLKIIFCKFCHCYIKKKNHGCFMVLQGF